MPDAYPPKYASMAGRAAPFHDTANLASLGAVLIALWFGFQIAVSALYPLFVTPATEQAFYFASTPATVRMNLALFGVYTAILLAMMHTIHDLRLPTLIGPLPRAVREFVRVTLYLSPIYALLILPSLTFPEAVQQYPTSTWLLLLPTMLPLLFVQISAEELVFRGYLQSHFAALSSNPIIWIGVPSALFGLIHYNPESPAFTAWTYVLWAAALGMICADLTARTGTLGPALAVHFINNIGALLILAADDWLYGAALYVWPTNGEPWVPWIPFEALFLLTVWLAARLAIRR